MKRMIFAVFCLTAGIGWAQDTDESKVEKTEKVELRMSVIESIVVTAQKAPVVSTDEPDEDIDAILGEVESLENEDERK
jgi:hypothetical protein